MNLGRGFTNFFDAKKKRKAGKKVRKVGFPKLKKKREEKQSFRMRNNRKQVRVNFDSITLSKFGAMRVKGSTRTLRRLLRERPDGQCAKILFVTVNHSAGRWHARINVEACDLHAAQQHVAPEWAEPVGVDLGLTYMAVVGKSDGTVLEHIDNAPKPLKRALKKLRIRNRDVARKKKAREAGSKKNRRKALRRRARVYRKIRNQRRHYLHNLTSRLEKTHAHLVIEDLNIAGMVRNHKLARSILDMGWGEWRRQLEYKAAWHKGRVTVAPWHFPSTKRCHKCRVIYPMPLGEKWFVCEPCGLRMPRDDNASANYRSGNCSRQKFSPRIDSIAC